MQFTLALLSVILPAVVIASAHKQCDCQVLKNGKWGPDWQLTFNVCRNDFSNTAQYDTGSAHCISNPHTRLDGDRFYRDCVAAATGGYYPITNGAIDTTRPVMKAHGGSGCYN